MLWLGRTNLATFLPRVIWLFFCPRTWQRLGNHTSCSLALLCLAQRIRSEARDAGAAKAKWGKDPGAVVRQFVLWNLVAWDVQQYHRWLRSAGMGSSLCGTHPCSHAPLKLIAYLNRPIEHRVHFGPEVSFYGQGPFSPATPTTATAATAEAGVEGSDGPWILGLFLIASTQAHWKAFHAHSANSGGSLARLHVTSRGSLHQAERGGWRILCEPWSRITCEFGE